jgi:hypothetical protein
MAHDSTYQERALKAASAAIAKGHRDAANLRELLISTTSTITCSMVQSYFRQHHDDRELLRALVAIALEGEDAGDAPWAAANTIAEFPAPMLVEHKAALFELSKHDWDYLKKPALEALAKIAGDAA